jgi:hypothetical protein
MEEEISAEELVQHPVYHGVCLAFWHTAQARGVAPMRSLSSGAIADAVYATVDIPKDRSTRQYVVAACSSWLREEHNFSGGWCSRKRVAWYGRPTLSRPLF